MRAIETRYAGYRFRSRHWLGWLRQASVLIFVLEIGILYGSKPAKADNPPNANFIFDTWQTLSMRQGYIGDLNQYTIERYAADAQSGAMRRIKVVSGNAPQAHSSPTGSYNKKEGKPRERRPKLGSLLCAMLSLPIGGAVQFGSYSAWERKHHLAGVGLWLLGAAIIFEGTIGFLLGVDFYSLLVGL